MMPRPGRRDSGSRVCVPPAPLPPPRPPPHCDVRTANVLLPVPVLPFMHAASSRFELSSFGQVLGDIVADTALVQRAVDSCASAGGGTVVIPAGPPITIATVVLKSHVDLHLSRGATLRGS